MIYFLCPDLPYPTGGVKQIQIQAAYLQEAGHEVMILYTGSVRPRIWFPTSVPCRVAPAWLRDKSSWKQRLVGWLRHLSRSVKSLPLPPQLPTVATPITDAELLVVPEIYAARLGELPATIPKLILNQNCFLSFHGLETASTDKAISLLARYKSAGVIGHLANSRYGESYLRWAFPGLPLLPLQLAVDFPPSVPELQQRDPLLVFFPRKSGEVLQQVFGILRNRGVMQGWRIQPLEGLTEAEVNQVFRQARLYIAASVQEGLGLPPLEAMANGCAVVGFPAWGGDTFLTEAFSRPVQTGDVLALAEAVETSLIELLEYPSRWQEKVDNARAMVKEFHGSVSAASSSRAAFEFFLKGKA